MSGHKLLQTLFAQKTSSGADKSRLVLSQIKGKYMFCSNCHVFSMIWIKVALQDNFAHFSTLVNHTIILLTRHKPDTFHNLLPKWIGIFQFMNLHSNYIVSNLEFFWIVNGYFSDCNTRCWNYTVFGKANLHLPKVYQNFSNFSKFTISSEWKIL